MPEETVSQCTLSFLPWLKLAEPVEIDDLVFWPFPAMVDQFDPGGIFKPQLQQIFSGYVAVKGSPVGELTVVSFREDPFKDLSNEEAFRIGEIVRLLAFCVMAENDYYPQTGQYFNATSFQHYHQRFRLGSEWVAPDTRRRGVEPFTGAINMVSLSSPCPFKR